VRKGNSQKEENEALESALNCALAATLDGRYVVAVSGSLMRALPKKGSRLKLETIFQGVM
jgi:hypothetical protein